MKLYYIPSACSLAVHIALRQVGVVPELVRYDPVTGKDETGAALKDVNPKGYVPTLIDKDGDVLTEVVATLVELDGRYPEAELLPVGGADRRRALEWLAYTSAELHRNFILPLFMDVPQTEDITAARAKVEMRLEHAAANVSASGPYFMGAQIGAVDFYLLVMMLWTGPAKVNLEQWPQMVAYRDRLLAVEPVREAMKAEGLI
ncbi:glutathione S-transferase N-terminal domain-containing protein [Algicella marina]|nr:glutathione S-transferase N-terminal domain-containing protein [Algicella marina]